MLRLYWSGDCPESGNQMDMSLLLIKTKMKIRIYLAIEGFWFGSPRSTGAESSEAAPGLPMGRRFGERIGPLMAPRTAIDLRHEGLWLVFGGAAVGDGAGPERGWWRIETGFAPGWVWRWEEVRGKGLGL